MGQKDKNIVYEARNLSFDGTENSVIDTGVYLFNEENINRDFEIIAEGLYGNEASSSVNSTHTIICAKHNGNSYGFLVRVYGTNSTAYSGTIFMKKDFYNPKLIIKRVNGIISIDGDTITNPGVTFINNIH